MFFIPMHIIPDNLKSISQKFSEFLYFRTKTKCAVNIYKTLSCLAGLQLLQWSNITFIKLFFCNNNLQESSACSLAYSLRSWGQSTENLSPVISVHRASECCCCPWLATLSTEKFGCSKFFLTWSFVTIFCANVLLVTMHLTWKFESIEQALF